MRPPSNIYVSKQSWKQLHKLQVKSSDYYNSKLNILFLLKILPINFTSHQWILFVTIIM